MPGGNNNNSNHLAEQSGTAFITGLRIFGLPLGCDQKSDMAAIAKVLGKVELQAATKAVAKHEIQALEAAKAKGKT